MLYHLQPSLLNVNMGLSGAVSEDSTTLVTTQHPRYTSGRFRRPSTCSSSARRGGGSRACCAREDAVYAHTQILRAGLETENYKGNQEYARAEFGGKQEIRGKRAETDEGGGAKS